MLRIMHSRCLSTDLSFELDLSRCKEIPKVQRVGDCRIFSHWQTTQSQHVTATTTREKHVMNGNCINAWKSATWWCHFNLMQFGWHTLGLASSMQSWIRMWRFREMLIDDSWIFFDAASNWAACCWQASLYSCNLTTNTGTRFEKVTKAIWYLFPPCVRGSCSLSMWDHLRRLETVFAWGNSMLEEGARGGAATVTFSGVRVCHHTRS